MTQDDDPKLVSQADNIKADKNDRITVHYGDIVVTVGQRFDRLDKEITLVAKAILVLAAGEILLLGIHLPEVGPILVTIAKLFVRN